MPVKQLNSDVPRKKEDRAQVTYNLPREIIERVKGHSERTDIPQARIVERALREWLDARTAKLPKEGETL
jgi:hypothetical protein